MPDRREFLKRLVHVGTGYAVGSRVGAQERQAVEGPASPAFAAVGAGIVPQLSGVESLEHSPDLFPIMPWDPLHGWKSPYTNPKQGLESIAECNFTMAGFVQPGDLALCEKLGLTAIIAPADSERPAAGRWTTLSDEQIDLAVRHMVESAAGSQAVMGYFIMDEPGVRAFPALAKAVRAVKKYAPGKLAYINLYPSYATVGAPDKSQLGTTTYTEYLERFVNDVKPQILSYDNYMVELSDDLQDTKKAAIYYADLLEVRRVAQKYALPFWNIVSCNQIRKETTIPSPANLAFQAYTTLAAGGRGLSWFKYYQGPYAYAPIDGAGDRTATWRYLQAVNRQVKVLGPALNRLTSTGVFFSSPPPVPSLPVLPGRVVDRVQSVASPRGLGQYEPPVMVGEFQDRKGGDYVMLVNLSLERSANIKIQTRKEYKSRQLISAEDARIVPFAEQYGFWLPAGHGALIRLESEGQS